MTDDQELEDAQLALRDLQRRTNEGIHELLNILAIIKGEVDLAVEKARGKLEKFYRDYPMFKD